MAATVECHGARSGLTLTASLFPDGSDTAAAANVECVEAENRQGVYTFSTEETGLHLIQLLEGATLRWIGWAVLTASGTIVADDSRSALLATENTIALPDLVEDVDGQRFTAKALEQTPIGDFTASVVVPPAIAQLSQIADKISAIRGDSLAASINIGTVPSYTKLWFTLKHSSNDSDSDAILQLEQSAGLLTVNGEAAPSPELGSITPSEDETGLSLLIKVAPAVMTQLTLRSNTQFWDIQYLSTTGDVVSPRAGTFFLQKDITRAVS